MMQTTLYHQPEHQLLPTIHISNITKFDMILQIHANQQETSLLLKKSDKIFKEKLNSNFVWHK